MQKYISILRGINVGAAKKILMADLKTLYETLGFTNVRTYIQSGNVAFTTDSTADLTVLIQTAIATKYSFTVPVIVLTDAELTAIVQNNPFIALTEDFTKLHVTFLGTLPNKIVLAKLKIISFAPDAFQIINRAVYLHCPIDYGHTKLSNSFFEKQLKVTATTRNWKTVLALMELNAL